MKTSLSTLGWDYDYPRIVTPFFADSPTLTRSSDHGFVVTACPRADEVDAFASDDENDAKRPVLATSICSEHTQLQKEFLSANDNRGLITDTETKNAVLVGPTNDLSSLYVSHLPKTAQKTALPWGISPSECQRLQAASDFLQSRRWPVACVTVVAHHLPERTIRQLLRDARNRMMVELQRAGMRKRYLVEVLEGQPTVHAHYLVAVNPNAMRRMQRLSGSPKFIQHDRGGDVSFHVQLANDLRGLVRYLTKEAASQALHLPNVRRKPGSHPLGEGGGDRVKLSSDLAAVLLTRGLIQPHRRSYAKLTKPLSYRSDRKTAGVPTTEISATTFDQLAA